MKSSYLFKDNNSKFKYNRNHVILLCIILFLAALALSLLPSRPLDSTKINEVNTTSSRKTSLSSDVEAIEIYKSSEFKETSILKNWYFRKPEDISLVFSCLNPSKKQVAPQPFEKTQYKIIFSYFDGKIEFFPFWINEKSKKAIYFNESYFYMDENSTKKLKDIMNNL